MFCCTFALGFVLLALLWFVHAAIETLRSHSVTYVVLSVCGLLSRAGLDRRDGSEHERGDRAQGRRFLGAAVGCVGVAQCALAWAAPPPQRLSWRWLSR
ncbi:MAG: hypothetical protein R2724_05395 [Bryobacterales bacterium]